MKILFLQPRAYFDRLLGAHFFDEDGLFVKYCMPVASIKLGAYLRTFDLVVSCLDHSTSANKIISACQVVNVKTLLIIDGTYDIANSISNPALKQTPFYQYCRQKYNFIFCVDIHAAYFLRGFCDHVYVYLPEHARVELTDGAKPSGILVCTSNSPYFNNSERSQLIRLIKETGDNAARLNMPIKYRIYDEYLLKELKIPKENLAIEESLAEAISNCEVLFTTPSTLAYSASLLGKPVGLYCYRNTLINQTYSWLISSGRDVKNMLEAHEREVEYRLGLQRSFIPSSPRLAFKSVFSEIKLKPAEKSPPPLEFSPPFFSLEPVIRRVYLRAKPLRGIRRLLNLIRYLR